MIDVKANYETKETAIAALKKFGDDVRAMADAAGIHVAFAAATSRKAAEGERLDGTSPALGDGAIVDECVCTTSSLDTGRTALLAATLYEYFARPLAQMLAKPMRRSKVDDLIEELARR